MDYFNGISSSTELKLIYRRLAMLNHPDLGGNPEVMKKINTEFSIAQKEISSDNSFAKLKPNDKVMINDSVGRVVYSGNETLIIKSESTNRRAAFSKKSGVCINNPQFKITLTKSTTHGF